MWRKGNPHTLFLGMQTGAATVESRMEFPQKIKNGSAFWPSMPLLGIYPKNPETLIQKNICIPMFIAALFTIPKVWKQPKGPSINEWIKSVVYLHNRLLHSCIKERNLTFCNSMDGPGDYYAKWNKPVRERQTPYDPTYMWNPMNKIKWQTK